MHPPVHVFAVALRFPDLGRAALDKALCFNTIRPLGVFFETSIRRLLKLIEKNTCHYINGGSARGATPSGQCALRKPLTHNLSRTYKITSISDTTVIFSFHRDPSSVKYAYLYCVKLYQCKYAIKIIP